MIRTAVKKKRLAATVIALLILCCLGQRNDALAEMTAAPQTSGGTFLENAGMIADTFVIHESGGEKAYALVVEKSSQTLILFDMSRRPEEVLRVRCSTGKNFGPKTVAGDAKTPEGIYFFIQEYQDKYLAPVYGVGAFPTDYPNLVDRLAGRTGSAIWLHGTNKDLAPFDSNGCIAVENEDLLTLSPFITLHRTPLIIVENLRYLPVGSGTAEKRIIRSMLSRWHKSITSAAYADYVGCYAAAPTDDLWWEAWEEIRNVMAARNIPLLLIVKNLTVYRDRHTYLAIFDQYVQSADTTVWVGTKKIFLEFRENDLYILGDTYQTLSEIGRKHPLQNPLITATRALEASATLARMKKPLPHRLISFPSNPRKSTNES